jgi:hypothetical protein
MAFTPAMIPYMVGGYAVDRMMGGNGMTGLALGTGVGGIGGFEGIASQLGMSGVSALPSATGANSLSAGAGLMGNTGTAASTAVGGSTGLSLLGSATGNANNLYNVGMNGVTGSGSAVTGGIADLGSAVVPTSTIDANAIPLRDYTGLLDSSNQVIGPDMSFKQSFLNPEKTVVGQFGTAQTPDYVSKALTNDPTKYGLTNSMADTYSDGIRDVIRQGPDLGKNIPLSEADKVAETGGYEAPLHERMMSSMVDFAKENPLTIATLGLTALDSSGEQQPITSGSVGSIARTAYNPPRSQLVKIQRA